MAEKEIKKQEPKKEETVVVEALPQQIIRDGEDEKNLYHFVTRDEALTEILITVRELKKGITG